MLSEKVVNQLDKSVSSKLEASVARQTQTQFQTSAKQSFQVFIFVITFVPSRSSLIVSEDGLMSYKYIHMLHCHIRRVVWLPELTLLCPGWS